MPEGRRQTAEISGLVVLFLGITAFTVAGFAHDWKPEVASLHGIGVDGVIRYLLLTTGAILVVGTLVFVAFLWRYGRGGPAPAPTTTPGVERWWSLVPVVGMALVAEAGVLWKGLPVWKEVYAPPPEDAVVVEVTAQQFEWIVRYPGGDGRFGRTNARLIESAGNPLGLDMEDPAAQDDLVSRNIMRIPLGRPVHVRLRSRDVLHSFSVPAFRVKQDVVPGIVGGIHFTATRTGTFEIACAELCGMAHYRMGGEVRVLEPEAFARWLAQEVEVLR